jgi:hypothetical protein
MNRRDHLRPQGSHDQRGLVSQGPGQVVQQLQRRIGGPVQILQQKQQRRLAGKPGQEPGYPLEQPLLLLALT